MGIYNAILRLLHMRIPDEEWIARTKPVVSELFDNTRMLVEAINADDIRTQVKAVKTLRCTGHLQPESLKKLGVPSSREARNVRKNLIESAWQIRYGTYWGVTSFGHRAYLNKTPGLESAEVEREMKSGRPKYVRGRYEEIILPVLPQLEKVSQFFADAVGHE